MNSTECFIVQPFGYAQEGTTQPRHLAQITIITDFLHSFKNSGQHLHIDMEVRIHFQGLLLKKASLARTKIPVCFGTKLRGHTILHLPYKAQYYKAKTSRLFFFFNGKGLFKTIFVPQFINLAWQSRDTTLPLVAGYSFFLSYLKEAESIKSYSWLSRFTYLI